MSRRNRKINMRDVLYLHQIPTPDIKSGIAKVQVACPRCDVGTNKKRMMVHLEDGYFNCIKCEERGKELNLYEFLKTGESPGTLDAKQTAGEIFKRLEENNLLDKDIEKHAVYHEESPIADLETRDLAYNAVLDNLRLDKKHIKSLGEVRGVDDAESFAKEKGYKSMPRTRLRGQKLAEKIRWDEGLTIEGVPGFFSEDEEGVTPDFNVYPNSMIIPVRDIPNIHTGERKIQGFQVRLDEKFNENAPRYLWVSSANKKNGTSAKTYAHFTGFPENELFFTEGPLKADLIRYFSGWSGIAVPGVKSIQEAIKMLEELRSLGVNVINLAYDMDWKTNIDVEEGLYNIYNIMYEMGFKVNVLDWNFDYKGLDDYFLAVKQGKTSLEIRKNIGTMGKRYSDIHELISEISVLKKRYGMDKIAITTTEQLDDSIKSVLNMYAQAFQNKAGVKPYFVQYKDLDKLNDGMLFTLGEGEKQFKLSMVL